MLHSSLGVRTTSWHAMPRAVLINVLLFVLIFPFSGLAMAGSKANEEERANYETPTKLLAPEEYPYFEDDLDFEYLETAIERQLKRFGEKQLNGTIQLGTKLFPQRQAIASLQVFLEKIRAAKSCLNRSKNKMTCFEEFNTSIRVDFDVFAPELAPGDPRYGEIKQTFFTAYYTPSLNVSKRKSAKYPFAIYDKPREENLAKLTRAEIDFDSKLKGKGYEIYYASNLFDLYILQVQGGGRVLVEEEKRENLYITYNGQNSQPWKFISKYMIEKGYIRDGSVRSQREYLEKNPAKHREVYSYCPGYVYFRNINTPPLGNDSVPLTDNRSIATDMNLYAFKGLLSFVVAERPVEKSVKDGDDKIVHRLFSRFMIDQDTGGAIRGKARVDLYFGEGPYAEYAANSIQNRGDLYFLMLKTSIKGAP